MINEQEKRKIGIFGGTYEGRLLAEFCQNENIPFAVSVATAYGNRLLSNDMALEDNAYSESKIPSESNTFEDKKHTKSHIQTGRMDAQEMAQWMEKEAITVVVDATHPFAQAVSREIRLACHLTQTEYLRLIREKPGTKIPPASGLSWVSSFKEAAALLNQELLQHGERKALLTIGSKELACFCTNPALQSRLFVRVLPSVEAIQLCQEAGFGGKQIIAMQGPFSCELNKALLLAIEASYLVTKESGKTGGFEEKLEAARLCGCQVIAIKRPQETEPGKSLEEIKKWLTDKYTKSQQESFESRREFILLGIGTGNAGQITWEGIQALARADAFLGAERIVESTKALCRQLSAANSFNPHSPVCSGFCLEDKQEYISYKKEEILSWLNRHPEIKHPAILFSGDTGFYSGAKGIYELLQTAFPSASLLLLPGISSLSYFAAKIGRSWEKAEILSFHGREERLDWSFADRKERFFLLDGEERLHQICRNLQEHGQEHAILWAGENLSYPTEKIICGSPKELLQMHFGKLLVAWICPGEVKS